jgi:DNA-binding transcriptional LysR family regulator
MLDLNDVLIFVRVVQAGGFSKAARLLGMPVSTVSRRVAELEEKLGVSLLVRTTRSLRVTEAGSAYLAHGRAIAAELEQAESLATSLQSIPQGVLRITAPVDFGNQFLGEILRDFLKTHPRVEADVALTERVVDLIGEGFDLAIRVGELEDSSLLSRRLGSLGLQLVASPAFLTERGSPRGCADLARFSCIRFTGDEEPDVWRLSGPNGEHAVRVRGRVSANNMALIRELALAGEGIALMPHFFCADDLRAGKLRVVLKDWVNAPGPVHVVYPRHRFVLPKVRSFVEHLARKCAGVPWRFRT